MQGGHYLLHPLLGAGPVAPNCDGLDGDAFRLPARLTGRIWRRHDIFVEVRVTTGLLARLPSSGYRLITFSMGGDCIFYCRIIVILKLNFRNRQET